jgi:hypothetical protein
VVRGFGLAEVRLTTNFHLGDATPDDLYALNSMEGITGLDILGTSSWDVIRTMPGVSSFATNMVDDAPDTTSLSVLGEKFPDLASLTLRISPLGEWDPAPFADFENVTDLSFHATGASIGSPLGSTCQETLDLILGLPDVMPKLATINGVQVAGLTAEGLGAANPSTRAEILWEKKVATNTKDLYAWATDTRDGGYPAGAATDSIAGPVVVYTDEEGDSIEDGVRAHDWKGIATAKLCKDAATCVSLVDVGFREGATSGSYTPQGGGAVAFTGKLGETIVTIYNASTGKMAGPIVVATTEPPQTVHSESEAVGPANRDAAYAWIAAHTAG